MNYKNNLIRNNLTISQAFKIMDKCLIKCLIVSNVKNIVIGTLSDGDLRRAILKKIKLNSKIDKIINRNYSHFYKKKINFDKAKKILKKQSNKIDVIPILNFDKTLNSVLDKSYFNKKIKTEKLNNSSAVIIMAGGRGTRLKPISNIIPKPLVPINNKTLIENIINNYIKFGLTNFYVSINYKSFLLKAFFKEISFKYKLKFIEEKKPLGTAGALGLLKKKNIIKNYFICNCDTMIKSNLNLIFKDHINSNKLMTLIACKKKYQIPYGLLKIDHNHNLIDINEKPKINTLINTGMYVINKKLLSYFKKNKYYSMDKVIRDLSQKNQINIYRISEKSWIDVGQWPEYTDFLKKFN